MSTDQVHQTSDDRTLEYSIGEADRPPTRRERRRQARLHRQQERARATARRQQERDRATAWRQQ